MSRIRNLCLVMMLLALLLVGPAAPAQAGGGGGCYTPRLSDEAATEVKVSENCFSPTVARIDEGDRVTWSSGEFEAPHTVTGAAGGFGSDDLPANGRVSFTFNEAGVYPYSCLLHPGMIGAIVVGNGAADRGMGDTGGDDDNGAATSTGSDGAAEESAAVASTDTSAVAETNTAAPWGTVLVVAVVVVLGLAAALLMRRRTRPASA